MTDRAALIEAILKRRSLSPRHLVEPAPSAADLAVMLKASAAAPDHKKLRPFRFILIPEHKRAALADAFREAKRERDPGAAGEELDRAAEKAARGPMLLAIVIRVLRDHPRVSAIDQMLAAGAAIENMLLAAGALGFGGCLRSGTSATSRTVREALGIDSGEDLAAFLILGTPAKTIAGERNDDVEGLLSVWD